MTDTETDAGGAPTRDGCACDGVGMCSEHIEQMLRDTGIDPTAPDRRPPTPSPERPDE